MKQLSKFEYKKIKGGKYKFEVTADYIIELPFYLPRYFSYYFETMLATDEPIIDRNSCKILIIKKGYQWDGASGPAFNTKNVIRASCIHDVFYQMIKDGFLIKSIYKDIADELLRMIILEDSNQKGFFSKYWSKFRANYYYLAVRVFGNFFL